MLLNNGMDVHMPNFPRDLCDDIVGSLPLDGYQIHKPRLKSTITVHHKNI